MFSLARFGAALGTNRVSAVRKAVTPTSFEATRRITVDTETDAYEGLWKRASRVRALPVHEHGVDLLHDPLWNKGTAFPMEERDRLGVRGLLPPRQVDLNTQYQRIMWAYEKQETALRKYTLLQGLHDRNESLFYYTLINNIKEMAPIVYTPTVGLACQKFAMIFNRSRGMYFSSEDVGHMSAMVYNWPISKVDVIVVTDGSRILGLGDLGVNGMGIPIGKLSLYVAAGGIRPWRVLPIVVDVGTNNQDLIDDPFYLGLKQPRLTGPAYTQVMDELLSSILQRWPKAMVQFEDFSNENAYRLLDRYREQFCCFNDDIQGTGAVALAGVMRAVKASQGPDARLSDQRVVVAGAGSAGLGVSRNIVLGMTKEGTSPKDAANNFWLCDQHGLLGTGRSSYDDGHDQFVRSDMETGMSLLEVVKKVKPTVILGLSGVGGIFTDEVLEEMCKHVEKPIIFPMSNPTAKSECTAEQVYRISEGRAIFASGSPFDPVTINGTTYAPSQANNMFIFPGVGLGASLVKSSKVTDEMLYAASVSLSNCVSDDEIADGKVYPEVERIRDVSREVAVAVAKTAIDQGLSRVSYWKDEGVEAYIARKMYVPMYYPLVRVDKGDV